MVHMTVEFILHVSSDLFDINWLEISIPFVCIQTLELKDTELDVSIANPSIHVLEEFTSIDVWSKPFVVSNHIEVFLSPPWPAAFPCTVIETKNKVPWSSANEVSTILRTSPTCFWIRKLYESTLCNINKFIGRGNNRWNIIWLISCAEE